MFVRLSSRLLSEIEHHARRAFPHECCGVLVGRSAEEEIRVERVIELANVAGAPEQRYEIDPESLLRVHRWGTDDGSVVVGYFHSHPRGQAVPSETDRAAAWPGSSYLITAVDARGTTTTRSWRLMRSSFEGASFEGASFEEEQLALEEHAA